MKILSWGSNSHGQLGQETKAEQVNEPSAVKIDVGGVRSIVGGGKHTIIVCKNGKLYSCGDNSQGQLALDTFTKTVSSFQAVNFTIKVVKVSCGWDFNLAISEEGHVFGWGGNSFGQLGLRREIALFLREPVKIFPDKAIDVGTGLRHSTIVTEKGLVFSSGFGRKGQLGISHGRDKIKVHSFVQVPYVQKARKVSCGESHTVLYAAGKLYSWGDNKFGQLGVNPNELPSSEVPVQIDYPIGNMEIKALASGWSHNAILTGEGKVISWGRQDCGQLGDQREENWKPEYVDDLTNIKQIAVGSNHGLALKHNGEILSWGWNEHGNCGIRICDNIYIPMPLKTFNFKTELIGSGSAHSFLYTDRA